MNKTTKIRPTVCCNELEFFGKFSWKNISGNCLQCGQKAKTEKRHPFWKLPVIMSWNNDKNNDKIFLGVLNCSNTLLSLFISLSKRCSILEGPPHLFPCEKRWWAGLTALSFTDPHRPTHPHTPTHTHTHTHTRQVGVAGWAEVTAESFLWMAVNRRVAWISPRACHAWPPLRRDNSTETPPPPNTRGCHPWHMCVCVHMDLIFGVCVCRYWACLTRSR